MEREQLKKRVLRASEEDFLALALDIFRFQARENLLYANYLHLLGTDAKKVSRLEEIPFMPISFFKFHKVLRQGASPMLTFRSSGTTGSQTSTHHVSDPEIYEKVALDIFEKHYGPLEELCLLALLPSYLERNDASLVYMVNHFLRKAGPGSGFFLTDLPKLWEQIAIAKKSGQKIMLIGVTFALLDLAEYPQDSLEGAIVMETGGMKGRRKEITRQEVHEILNERLGVGKVHSEYGMTELLSQAYSPGDGVFLPSATMKVLFREINDPFSVGEVQTGGINVVDLANLDSCSFIETHDLGRGGPNGQFEVTGRFDHSDVRGCNLMLEI